MKKRFKLIKTYPNSVELGTIVEKECDEYGVQFAKYPEFWQEVKEEYPKIVAMKIKSGSILYYEGEKCVKRSDDYPVKTNILESYSLSEALKKGLEIYQVAKSPDEIFTIGDVVQHKNRLKDSSLEDVGKIKKFKIEYNVITVYYGDDDGLFSVDGCFWNSINCIVKADPTYTKSDIQTAYVEYRYYLGFDIPTFNGFMDYLFNKYEQSK